MVEIPTSCITCGTLIPHGKSRCPAHTPKYNSRWALHAAKHPERAAFYASPRWRERRTAWLRANPDCVICGKPATAADHIINLASGGTFDGPLQSLCRDHHKAKTQAESKEGNRRAARRRRREAQTSGESTRSARCTVLVPQVELKGMEQ